MIGGGLTLQSRTRLSGDAFDPDGNAALSVGLGNPEKMLGLEARLNFYGLGNSAGAPGNLGEGTLDLHASRRLSDRFWVGAGVFDLTGWQREEPNKLTSFYATATGVLTLHPFRFPFGKKLYLTAGLGNGRFRTDDTYTLAKKGPAGIFGSVAVPLWREGNFVAEWSGYNVFIGLSFFPLKKLPGQIIIGVDDLFHEKRKIVVAGSVGLLLGKNQRKTQFHGLVIPAFPPPQTSRI